ncbi:hypothetical protein GQ600_9330 [Phytophthora cactorum]|nr:hypothetical protein GQ600_9330 [Phytophthora cactorum]
MEGSGSEGIALSPLETRVTVPTDRDVLEAGQ